MPIVTRLDRLARSMRDLLDIVHNIEAMGGGGTASSSTDKPVSQALESVLGMALQMPAMQAL
ncbi:MAG: hypothetical protein ABJE99_00030 [Roseobacter sp.]